MRLINLTIGGLLFLVVGFGLAATSAPQGESDKILTRDGKDFYGYLNSVDEKTVKVSGKSYQRAGVKLIRLAGAIDAVPDVSQTDLVIMRDGKRISGHISRVTDKLVYVSDTDDHRTTDRGTFERNNTRLVRQDVAVLRFADRLNILTAIPQPSSNPTPAGSPTPGAETVPAQENPSEQANKEDKGSGKGKDQAPWFDTEGCGSIQTPYVFVDGSLMPDGKKMRCRMWINVCGTIIERQKILDSGLAGCWNDKDISRPQVCCDTWQKYADSPDGRWDPKKDADGDGIPNDQDDNPLAPPKNTAKPF